ncbi:MAG TPA: metallophosphoesterase [Bacillota bacterium]
MVKRRAFLLSCFLVLLSVLSVLAPIYACPAGLKIGLIGDQTASYDLQQSYQILSQGVEALQTNGVELMLHLGDLVESSGSVEVVRSQFAQATAILNCTNIPWFLTAGDHDVHPPVYQQNSSDRSREQLFQSLYAQLNPRVTERLYYSFDIKGYHFISLYTQEYLHTDSRWGNVFLARISDAQYNWLQADLEANRQKNTIVFLHKPLWYNWSSWSKIHHLLRRYKVKAVIASHFHYNQDEGVLDGIHYLVVGATGGMIKSGSPNAGGIHHVTVMNLCANGTFNLTLLPLGQGSAGPTTFTSRYVMDRVQALDVVLGNLWSFTADNPVYLKDGKLTNSPDSAGPARLQLTGLGNPTELPVKITIDFSCDDPQVTLVESQFAADAGTIPAGSSNQCILKPSYGIYIANTSSVDADTSKPLWVGTLGVNGLEPRVGAQINLKITMAFTDSDGAEYSIATQVSTPIQSIPE